jgi:hypothetical protein
MAAVLKGQAALYGIPAESGGMMQSVEIEDKVDEAIIKNEVGEDVSIALYNPRAEWSGEFYPKDPAAGIGSIAPAATYSFNSIVRTGLEIIKSVKESFSNTNFKKVSFSGASYPLITS